jgi:hypothetical protein
MTGDIGLCGALATLRWGASALSTEIGVNERTVRRWISGDNAPPDAILQWLDRLAAFHRDNPVPQRKEMT